MKYYPGLTLFFYLAIFIPWCLFGWIRAGTLLNAAVEGIGLFFTAVVLAQVAKDGWPWVRAKLYGRVG